jgi:hypothetical protein
MSNFIITLERDNIFSRRKEITIDADAVIIDNNNLMVFDEAGDHAAVIPIKNLYSYIKSEVKNNG